jgi:hypothetical protein
MKTSKIILTAYFSFIVLIFLSLLIPFKILKWNDLNMEETINISPVNHLVIQDISYCGIVESETNKIVYWHLKTLPRSIDFYSIKGDTLLINNHPLNLADNGLSLCLNNLESIEIKNSHISIDTLSNGELNVFLSKGELGLSERINGLKKLNVHLREKSWLWCYCTGLKEVKLDIDNSNADFSEAVDELKANLRDSSELSVNKVLHSDISTDKTSRYISQ